MSPRVGIVLGCLLISFGVGLTFGWQYGLFVLTISIGWIATDFVNWKKKIFMTTVEVDGYFVSFECSMNDMHPEEIQYMNIDKYVEDEKGIEWFVFLRAIRLSKLPSEGLVHIGTELPAKLTLGSETLTFFVDKEGTRCPCPAVPPCWIGIAYKAQFVQSAVDDHWFVGLYLIRKDDKYRGPRRRKHKVEEEEVKGMGMEPVFT